MEKFNIIIPLFIGLLISLFSLWGFRVDDKVTLNFLLILNVVFDFIAFIAIAVYLVSNKFVKTKSEEL